MKNWFKTLWLTSEEREILRAGREKKVAPVEEKEHATYWPAEGRPYKNMYFSNGNVTVVMKDGTVLSRQGVDHAFFMLVKGASTQQEVEAIMIETAASNVSDFKEDKELVSNNLEVFTGSADFEIKGKEVFLKGVNLALPAVVASSFIEILEKQEALATDPAQYGPGLAAEYFEQYNALKMFWLKLALNTLEQSREDLLTFVRKNNVRITPNGNLVLYRRIVTKDGTDQKFVTFVSQQYYRLKKEGQDTRNFAVAKVGDDYGLIDLRDYNGETGPEPFINLQVAYLELPNYETNRFTAYHGRNTDIRIGGIYKIPDTAINLNNGLCAAGGLHAAAVDYDYSGFGDTPVVVLVNPSKAITVPTNETGKMRTVEMFIACVNDKPLGVHFDDSALSAFDNEYHDLSLNELEEAAKSKSFEKLAVQETVPAVSLVDLNVIKEMLKGRVKDVI